MTTTDALAEALKSIHFSLDALRVNFAQNGCPSHAAGDALTAAIRATKAAHRLAGVDYVVGLPDADAAMRFLAR